MANEQVVLTLGFNLQGGLSQLDREISAFERRRPLKINLDTSAISKGTQSFNEFDTAIQRTGKHILAFGASIATLELFRRGIVDSVKAAIQLDAALTKINLNLNVSSGKLQQFGKSLFEIARNTGQSIEEVTKAADELATQGLSVNETLKRTSAALILVRQSGLSLEESIEAITSAINEFKKESLSANDVINRFASVEGKFAVSSKTIAEAVTRVGSSANEAGVSLNQLIALITTASQVTQRDGAVIGNALAQIFNSERKQTTIEAFRNLGIQVEKIPGQYLPAIQILKNVADKYSTASDVQKQFIATQVGGTRQLNILTAVLGDVNKGYGTYQNSLQAVNSATDNAIQKNDKLNKTFAAQANAAAQSLQQVAAAVGKLTLGPLFDRTIGNFNDITKLLSKGGDNGAEKFGAQLGAGILKGIGDAIAGPGLVIGGVILAKLVGQVGKYASAAVGDLLKTNSATEKQEALQKSINTALKQQGVSYQSLLAFGNDRVAQEQYVLDLIKQQTAAQIGAKALSSSISSSLYNQGARSSGGQIRFSAGGFLPDSVASAINNERTATSQNVGGGAGANPVIVPDFSIGGQKQTIVANDKEFFVPTTSLNPSYNGPDKVSIVNQEMIRSLGGVPPGATPIHAKGFFPDSKIRDKEGNLIPFFHGTSEASFDNIDPYQSRHGLYGQGSYFSDNIDIAQSYTKKGKGKNKGIYAALLNIKNPLIMESEADTHAVKNSYLYKDLYDQDLEALVSKPGVTNKEIYKGLEDSAASQYSDYPHYEVEEMLQNFVESMGHDGILHKGGGLHKNSDGTRHNVAIAYHPNQIHSLGKKNFALGNIPHEVFGDPSIISSILPYLLGGASALGLGGIGKSILSSLFEGKTGEINSRSNYSPKSSSGAVDINQLINNKHNNDYFNELFPGSFGDTPYEGNASPPIDIPDNAYSNANLGKLDTNNQRARELRAIKQLGLIGTNKVKSRKRRGLVAEASRLGLGSLDNLNKFEIANLINLHKISDSSDLAQGGLFQRGLTLGDNVDKNFSILKRVGFRADGYVPKNAAVGFGGLVGEGFSRQVFDAGDNVLSRPRTKQQIIKGLKSTYNSKKILDVLLQPENLSSIVDESRGLRVLQQIAGEKLGGPKIRRIGKRGTYISEKIHEPTLAEISLSGLGDISGFRGQYGSTLKKYGLEDRDVNNYNLAGNVNTGRAIPLDFGELYSAGGKGQAGKIEAIRKLSHGDKNLRAKLNLASRKLGLGLNFADGLDSSGLYGKLKLAGGIGLGALALSAPGSPFFSPELGGALPGIAAGTFLGAKALHGGLSGKDGVLDALHDNFDFSKYSVSKLGGYFKNLLGRQNLQTSHPVPESLLQKNVRIQNNKYNKLSSKSFLKEANQISQLAKNYDSYDEASSKLANFKPKLQAFLEQADPNTASTLLNRIKHTGLNVEGFRLVKARNFLKSGGKFNIKAKGFIPKNFATSYYPDDDNNVNKGNFPDYYKNILKQNALKLGLNINDKEDFESLRQRIIVKAGNKSKNLNPDILNPPIQSFFPPPSPPFRNADQNAVLDKVVIGRGHNIKDFTDASGSPITNILKDKRVDPNLIRQIGSSIEVSANEQNVPLEPREKYRLARRYIRNNANTLQTQLDEFNNPPPPPPPEPSALEKGRALAVKKSFDISSLDLLRNDSNQPLPLLNNKGEIAPNILNQVKSQLNKSNTKYQNPFNKQQIEDLAKELITKNLVNFSNEAEKQLSNVSVNQDAVEKQIQELTKKTQGNKLANDINHSISRLKNLTPAQEQAFLQATQDSLKANYTSQQLRHPGTISAIEEYSNAELNTLKKHIERGQNDRSISNNNADFSSSFINQHGGYLGGGGRAAGKIDAFIRKQVALGADEGEIRGQVGNLQQETKQRSFASRSQLGLQSSFLLPLITNSVTSLAGDNLSTKNKDLVNGFGNSVATGGAIASLAPGNPYVLAVAGIVTALGSFKTALDSIGPSVEDITKANEDYADKQRESLQGGAAYLQTQNGISDIIDAGGNPEQIARAQKISLQAFQGIKSDDLRNKLAGKSKEEQAGILADFANTTNTQVNRNSLNQNLAELGVGKPSLAKLFGGGINDRFKNNDDEGANKLAGNLATTGTDITKIKGILSGVFSQHDIDILVALTREKEKNNQANETSTKLLDDANSSFENFNKTIGRALSQGAFRSTFSAQGSFNQRSASLGLANGLLDINSDLINPNTALDLKNQITVGNIKNQTQLDTSKVLGSATQDLSTFFSDKSLDRGDNSIVNFANSTLSGLKDLTGDQALEKLQQLSDTAKDNVGLQEKINDIIIKTQQDLANIKQNSDNQLALQKQANDLAQKNIEIQVNKGIGGGISTFTDPSKFSNISDPILLGLLNLNNRDLFNSPLQAKNRIFNQGFTNNDRLNSRQSIIDTNANFGRTNAGLVQALQTAAGNDPTITANIAKTFGGNSANDIASGHSSDFAGLASQALGGLGRLTGDFDFVKDRLSREALGGAQNLDFSEVLKDLRNLANSSGSRGQKSNEQQLNKVGDVFDVLNDIIKKVSGASTTQSESLFKNSKTDGISNAIKQGTPLDSTSKLLESATSLVTSQNSLNITIQKLTDIQSKFLSSQGALAVSTINNNADLKIQPLQARIAQNDDPSIQLIRRVNSGKGIGNYSPDQAADLINKYDSAVQEKAALQKQIDDINKDRNNQLNGIKNDQSSGKNDQTIGVDAKVAVAVNIAGNLGDAQKLDGLQDLVEQFVLNVIKPGAVDNSRPPSTDIFNQKLTL